MTCACVADWRVVPQRGSWRLDAETCALVEMSRIDTYADRVERERLALPRSRVVQP